MRRNPKDVAISMFNFWMKLNIIDKDLPFCDFLENFINGNSKCNLLYVMTDSIDLIYIYKFTTY